MQAPTALTCLVLYLQAFHTQAEQAVMLEDSTNASIPFAEWDNLHVGVMALPTSIPFETDFLKQSSAPPTVNLTSFVWNGSGCPQPAGLYIDFDKHSGAFQFYTPRFIASSGQDHDLADSRKACTVNFNFQVPRGWQYSLRTAESQGYVGISSGTAHVDGKYWYTGHADTMKWNGPLQGPKHEQWIIGYRPQEDEGIWSPCGSAQSSLNVAMSLYVPKLENSTVALLEWTNLYVRWKECKD